MDPRELRWFTDAAYERDDEAAWTAMLERYAAHVRSISPRLPEGLLRLATDGALDLHDAVIEELVVDPGARRIRSTTWNAGRRIVLELADAELLGEDYARLSKAVTASYRWRGRRSGTRIEAQEVDLAGDLAVLRLRLAPFHRVAVACRGASIAVSTAAEPASGVPRFILTRDARRRA